MRTALDFDRMRNKRHAWDAPGSWEGRLPSQRLRPSDCHRSAPVRCRRDFSLETKSPRNGVDSTLLSPRAGRRRFATGSIPPRAELSRLF